MISIIVTFVSRHRQRPRHRHHLARRRFTDSRRWAIHCHPICRLCTRSKTPPPDSPAHRRERTAAAGKKPCHSRSIDRLALLQERRPAVMRSRMAIPPAIFIWIHQSRKNMVLHGARGRGHVLSSNITLGASPAQPSPGRRLLARRLATHPRPIFSI